MLKHFFSSLLLLLAVTTISAAAMPAEFVFSLDQERYIKRYKDIAIREMERSGVPASIKLAQGILESDSGKSRLASAANNHFGIKCGSQWKGEEYYKRDDDYDDNGQLIKSCFRKYRNPDASYVAHSEFLRDPAKSFRYGFLFRLDPTDYRGWAEGLRRAGYATNPRYPQLLISIIERYNLQQYDAPGAVDPV
ncbi:MAG: glucosaminidase domain-containing protein, partial [Bacteroidota bacterium]